MCVRCWGVNVWLRTQLLNTIALCYYCCCWGTGLELRRWNKRVACCVTAETGGVCCNFFFPGGENSSNVVQIPPVWAVSDSYSPLVYILGFFFLNATWTRFAIIVWSCARRASADNLFTPSALFSYCTWCLFWTALIYLFDFLASAPCCGANGLVYMKCRGADREGGSDSAQAAPSWEEGGGARDQNHNKSDITQPCGWYE